MIELEEPVKYFGIGLYDKIMLPIKNRIKKT